MNNLQLRLGRIALQLQCVLQQRGILSFQRSPSFLCTHSHYTSVQENLDDKKSGDGRKVETRAHRSAFDSPQKLHRRILTEADRENDRRYFETVLPSSDDNTFGDLRKGNRKTPSWERRHQFEKKDFKLHERLHTRRDETHATDHSDTFGTLTDDQSFIGQESLHSEIGSHNERFQGDPDDNTPTHIRLSSTNRRHNHFWYGQRIEEFGEQGKVSAAISVLEDWMLKRDRVKPSVYTFTTLIGVLGRVGYTKKAFQMFKKMRDFGLQPRSQTYSALFNACANSPWQQDGLNRARKLREYIQSRDIDVNRATYHAMLKAFGMLGDLQTAFMLMDEAITKFPPRPETFSFLLMACISDSRAGFKHAVEVWRLMLRFKVTPDLELYNLLLRSVRDCRAGNEKYVAELLRQQEQDLSLETDTHSPLLLESSKISRSEPIAEPLKLRTSESNTLPDSSNFDSPVEEDKCREMEDMLREENTIDSKLPDKVHQELQVVLPNLLDPHTDWTRIVSIGDLTHRHDRLAVIGGATGFLDMMQRDEAQPSVTTFTQLVEVTPYNDQAEDSLLAKMEALGVKPDTTFFNTLLLKRAKRGSIDSTRSVLKMISEAQLYPDMKTFGALALTCRSKKDGMQLLEDVENNGLSPSIEILSTLMMKSHLDFGYKLMVLKYTERLDLPPIERFIENVEKSISKAKYKIVQVEKGLMWDNFISSEYFKSSFEEFMVYYKDWLKKTKLDIKPHPWSAFQKKDVN